MKCRVCRGPAVIDVRRHNANFCPEHFLKLCRDQTAKAIKQFAMFAPDDRLLVAVSGGKDSLAAWDILTELGYEVDGFYVGLGIGEYSETSAGFAARFAAERGLTLHSEDLLRDHGFDVPHGSRAAKRAPCSACGLSKRHLFDEAARRGGYDAIVTGHNLDDEAAVLMGNVLHWHTDYLARQSPLLAARDGFPKKAKPLVRLTERETAAYCLLRGIDYLVDECPMAAGNKHLSYKEALNDIERQSPGAKYDFYFRFLDQAAHRFATEGTGADETRAAVHPCTRCGAPTNNEICSFCALTDRATSAVPLRLGETRRGSRRTVEVGS
ncbi:MAG: tRNA(Ile)-lysidine synthetase [Actinomycetota bacterium]